jgi:hypothetical protein
VPATPIEFRGGPSHALVHRDQGVPVAFDGCELREEIADGHLDQRRVEITARTMLLPDMDRAPLKAVEAQRRRFDTGVERLGGVHKPSLRILRVEEIDRDVEHHYVRRRDSARRPGL